MGEVVVGTWYEKLVKDVKQIEYKSIVFGKHAIGKRVLEDFEKFGKSQYGEKRVAHLAKDCGVATREIYCCIQFASLYPELCDAVTQLSWRSITHDVLPEHKKQEREARGKDTEDVDPPKPSKLPKLGGVYDLGRHILYCGDSADTSFIAACRKKDPAFVFADPPYNEDLAEWDSSFTWRHDYLSEVAPIVAVTPGISNIQSFMRETDMPYKWAMSFYINNGMTRGALGFGNWIFVPLFATCALHRNAQDHQEISIRAQDAGPVKDKGRKPLGLLRILLDLFTKDGEEVLDPFLGASATTLMACEEMGRTCIAAEIVPERCGWAIARWERKTGEKVVARG